MEAIGQLAGGVAHDFNNLLTIILGYAQRLERKFSAEEPERRQVQRILEAGERGAALVDQLLVFAKREFVSPEVLDLNDVIGGIEKLLRRLLPESIQVRTTRGAGLPAIRADRVQIEQILMNLVINAGDAMPHGGDLRIETSVREVSDTDSLNRVSGRYVVLSVADTGCGMDPATVSRIFEPFFTTKGPGKGTGLGLATVYGIATRNGGYIDVASEPGAGTRFDVFLPAAVDVPASAKPATPASASPGGSETVLVVEDQADVRAAVVETLVERGYTVLQATSSDEALQYARLHSGPIHLLLTDVVLNDAAGPQVAASVRAVRPETQVLYMSGYAADTLSQHGVEPGFAFVHKPFTADALSSGVRAVLGDSRPVMAECA